MKKNFEAPEIEVVKLEACDILTESNGFDAEDDKIKY